MQLRARITLVAVSATLLVALGLVVAGRMSQESVEERFEEAVHVGKSQLWNRILASKRDRMEDGISALSRDKETRDALSAGDRKLLAERAQTSFNLMSASETISRLQLTDVEGNVLYSAPQTFSGKTRKSLVRKAIETGKVVGGVERDDDGVLINTVAFPLFTRGKPVGVGVFARDLKDAVADFKKSDGADLFIAGEDGRVLHGSDAELFNRLGTKLPAVGKRNFAEVKVGEGVFSVAVQPVLDAEEKPVAHLVAVIDNTASYHRQRTVNAAAYSVTALLVLAGIFGISWYLRRSFAPLQEAVRSLQAIATGDLRVDVEPLARRAGDDEIGALLRAQAQTGRVLRDMIGQIEAMTEAVAGAAAHLLEIASRTSGDVSRLQQESSRLTDAMSHMSGTVGEVSHHAGGAADAAATADAESQGGRAIVRETLDAIRALVADVEQSGEAIQALEEESGRIGAVIEVIRSIAEQTNLLALNAAIEAARAGEQGRGFAVVADEVRTLASRTQKSTEEIQGMIERLQRGTHRVVDSMSNGRSRAAITAEHAAKAGRALDSITEAVGVISRMNAQIAGAAEQQGSVAAEIDRNIARIAEIASSSAEAAGQTSAASEQLRHSAEQLRQMVHRFTL